MQRRYTSTLIGRINECANEALRKTAYIAAEKMERTFQKTIQLFYESYTPEYYDRNRSLERLSNMYGENYKAGVRSKLGDYYVHLSISPDNIKGIDLSEYGENGDYNWVFERSFTYGIHGFTSEENEEWTKRANDDPKNYSWRHKNIRAGQKMQTSYSPRRVFIKWFNTFKKNGEINKIFQECLKESIKKNLKR